MWVFNKSHIIIVTGGPSVQLLKIAIRKKNVEVVSYALTWCLFNSVNHRLIGLFFIIYKSIIMSIDMAWSYKNL